MSLFLKLPEVGKMKVAQLDEVLAAYEKVGLSVPKDFENAAEKKEFIIHTAEEKGVPHILTEEDLAKNELYADLNAGDIILLPLGIDPNADLEEFEGPLAKYKVLEAIEATDEEGNPNPAGNLAVGDVVEVPEILGDSWVAKGWAEKVDTQNAQNGAGKGGDTKNGDNGAGDGKNASGAKNEATDEVLDPTSDESIAKALALGVRYEGAIVAKIRPTTASGIIRYELDTGAARYTVSKADLAKIISKTLS